MADTSSSTFCKQRTHVVIAMFIGYSCFYLTRKSFTYSSPILLADETLHLTHESVGMISTTMMLSHCVGKFVCGVLSDSVSNPLMFSAGLFFSGLVNILFASCSSAHLFAGCWAVNGFLQGFGWAPCAKLINRWYRPQEIGTIWSVLTVSGNISSSFIPLLMASLSGALGWRMAFVSVGVFSCFLSILLLLVVRDPQQPASQDSSTVAVNTPPEASGSVIELLRSPPLFLLTGAYLLNSVLRGGLEDWVLVYLVDAHQYSQYQASFGVMALQLGGFVGSIASGFISDMFVSRSGSSRIPVILMYTAPIFIWIYLLQSQVHNLLSVCVICALIGFCLYGPHSLYGLVAVETAPAGLDGTSHAIAATGATVGQSMSGFPLAYALRYYGWTNVFHGLQAVVLSNVCLLFALSKFSKFKMKTA